MRSADVFGAHFGNLMARLVREYDRVAADSIDIHEQESLRSKVGAAFEVEAEELITEHDIPGPVAEYVRHVLREGFDAAYDPMDPSRLALAANARSSQPVAWTSAPPFQEGAYAIRPPGEGLQVEMASFRRHDGGWLVRRWGIVGGSRWNALVDAGWRRCSARRILPSP